MLTIQFTPLPTIQRLVKRLALTYRLRCISACCAYHERRAARARFGMLYARNHGTLPQHEGYFHDIHNESALWIKWAHREMVVIKSDLARIDQ